MPRFQILPSETRFYDWFEKGSATLLEAAHLLQDLVNNFERPDGKVARITEVEHQGDFIVHEITDLLHKTLITPMDSEDIQQLAQGIDDVIDSIEQAAVHMIVYQVEQPTPIAKELASLIVQCAEAINKAMPLLRNKDTLPGIQKYVIEINRLENEGDRLIQLGMQELVARARNDWFEFTRWKQIYDDLEEATDRSEDIADLLKTVVVKNA